MRINPHILSFAFILLSIFSFSLYGSNETTYMEVPTDENLDISPLKIEFNTVYIEDYGAIANDAIDDGAAIQLAVDANIAGTVNHIKSKTGGKFIIANGPVNLDGVKDLYFELHPNAEVIATGNFPAFSSIFNITAGDVSITNIVFDGFTLGSEYDANLNGGTNGSKGGVYYGTRVADGSDPNLLNPAVIWIGGVQLDGFTFKNMKSTNPSNNAYFIKLHNESGTAFTKNVNIHDNYAYDLGGMFVEIVNQNSPSENRFENINIYRNRIDNLGIFGHGIAISLAGTGRNLNVHHNTYSNLFFGFELVGGSDVHWHNETFLEGVDHFWSFSKDAAVATGFSRNITVNDISGQYPTAGPNIVEYVENSTFTNVKILGNGFGGIEVRHSKDVTFFNTKIKAKNFGTFLFTGDDANNSQANENIKIYNPDLQNTSSGGNPLLAGIGNQLGDVTIYEGQLRNDVGPLWIANGSTAEPKYKNVSTERNGVKDIINPSKAEPNSIEFTETPKDLVAGDSVEITVNYTISAPSAYVLVRLENPNGDNPQDFITKSGTGSHTFTIPVPESSGSGYRWLAQLLSVDGSWAGLAHQFVEDVSVGDATLPEVPNSIEFTEVPTDLIARDSIEVTVNYSISDPSAYVLVRLENPNGDNLEDYVEKSGTGSHTFNFQVPESSGSDYRWQAILVGAGGGWPDLAKQVVEGVIVGASVPSEVDSITLTATPGQVAQGESYDISFNYTFTGSRWVQVWMTNRAVDENGNWVKIAQAYKQFDPGAGKNLISIQVTGQPLDRNLLFVQVFEVVNVNGRNVWSRVLDKRVDNIDFENSNGVGQKGIVPKDLTVSPNPFINSFTYEYSVQKSEVITIELFSMTGLKVKTIKQGENHKAGNYSGKIDTADLDSGVYILRISSSSRKEEMRLVKN